MLSSILSALARLDTGLQTIQSQTDRLGAGLEVDEKQLKQALEDADRDSSSVRDLILAERSDADWSNREGLDQLIHEMEVAAAAAANQQRRNRLFDLANELDAGTVKHRLAIRSAVLNKLRVEAVDQLLHEAALEEGTKELPGPGARLWLSWACNLDDDNDAAILSRLREDFPALEGFTAAMNLDYWLPAEPTPESPGHPLEQLAVAAEQPPVAAPVVPSASTPAVHQDQVLSAMQNGNYHEALSLCYDEPSTAASAEPDHPLLEHAAKNWHETTGALLTDPSLAEAKSTVQHVKRCEKCGSTFPEVFRVCPFDNSALAMIPGATAEAAPLEAGVGPQEQREPDAVVPAVSQVQAEAPTPPSPELRDASPVETPILAAQESAGDESATSEITQDQLPRDLEAPTFIVEPAPRKRLVVAWAAGFIVLSVLFFFLIYHFRRAAENRVEQTVAAASPKPNAGDSEPPPDAAAGPLLHKQAAEGPQDKIGLSVELCGRGTEGSIECWGYVSNLGDADSKVSLDHADVVDGRGNSFTVDRSGPFTFPAGHSSTIAPGSRVRYTIKVADPDLDARTVTLYMDLSNPRNLEYTFRDIPVTNN